MDLSRKLISMFNSLGDKTRYRIVELLSTRKDICVSELSTELGISTAGTSQQLKILEQGGILEPERMGQRICYRIRKEDKTVQQVIKLIKERQQ